MSKQFNQLLGAILDAMDRELQSHGPLSPGQKRNLIRDVAQSLNQTWPFSNEGERLFARFLDESALPYVYADQDLETYSGTFYNEVTRPDFQIFIQEISSTFWVDTKYKTVYNSKVYRNLAWIISENLNYSCVNEGVIGTLLSAIIIPYKKYFMIDRLEFNRLRNFQSISNSQVWICLISKQDNPPVGHFWNLKTIWEHSFRRKDNNLSEEDHNKHIYFEPMDPIELPYDGGFARKVDLVNGKSLACLFEPSEHELQIHKDRLHKHSTWRSEKT